MINQEKLVDQLKELDTKMLGFVYHEIQKELSERKKEKEKQEFFKEFQGIKKFVPQLRRLNKIRTVKVGEDIYELAWISDISCNVKLNGGYIYTPSYKVPYSKWPKQIKKAKEKFDEEIKKLCDDFDIWWENNKHKFNIKKSKEKYFSINQYDVFANLTDFCGYREVCDKF